MMPPWVFAKLVWQILARCSDSRFQPESELFCKDLAFLSIPLPLTIMIGAVCSAKTGRPHTKLEFAAHPPWQKDAKAQALETLQFSSIRDCILLTESLGTRTRCDKCLEKPEDGFGLISASLRFYRFETLWVIIIGFSAWHTSWKLCWICQLEPDRGLVHPKESKRIQKSWSHRIASLLITGSTFPYFSAHRGHILYQSTCRAQKLLWTIEVNKCKQSELAALCRIGCWIQTEFMDEFAGKLVKHNRRMSRVSLPVLWSQKTSNTVLIRALLLHQNLRAL